MRRFHDPPFHAIRVSGGKVRIRVPRHLARRDPCEGGFWNSDSAISLCVADHIESFECLLASVGCWSRIFCDIPATVFVGRVRLDDNRFWNGRPTGTIGTRFLRYSGVSGSRRLERIYSRDFPMRTWKSGYRLGSIRPRPVT